MKRMPAIVIHKKDRWTSISKEVTRRGWRYERAINVQEGIKMFPVTEADYRGITGFLRGNGEEFHSYQLPEDRQIHAVIRGLPVEIELEEVKAELEEKGFRIGTLTRLKRGTERTVMPLILVKVSPDQKRIYEITDLCSMRIKMEPLRRSGGVG